MGARRAFDFVGDFDDNELFVGGTDEHRIADLRLEDAPPPPESDDELLYRLGLGGRAEEEEFFAAQRWDDEDDS